MTKVTLFAFLIPFVCVLGIFVGIRGLYALKKEKTTYGRTTLIVGLVLNILIFFFWLFVMGSAFLESGR